MMIDRSYHKKHFPSHTLRGNIVFIKNNTNLTTRIRSEGYIDLTYSETLLVLVHCSA